MALEQDLTWKNGTVLRVRFLDGIKAIQDKVSQGCSWYSWSNFRQVMEYARQWTQHTNIAFDVVRTEGAEIRVTFNQGGNFSYVGTASLKVPKDESTINLVLSEDSPEEKFARAALHAFGLAIGLKHVHLVTPADIPWDLGAFYAYYKRTQGWIREQADLNVLNLLLSDTRPSLRSDRDSIMLFLIPADLTNNQLSVQSRGILSERDISLVSGLYPRNDLNAGRVPTTHNWKTAPKGFTYKLQQPINPAASAVPDVAIGLVNVDVDIPQDRIRIATEADTVTTSNTNLIIKTWDETALYNGICSVFWSVPPSSDPTFQCGSYYNKGQVINQRINFKIPFKTRPRVFVGLSAIELDQTGGWNLDATVVSTDRAGFLINLTSTKATDLKSVAIYWIAWPENRPGVETGSFYAGRTEQYKDATGTIQFDTAFDRQPVVHYALASFNFPKDYGFRVGLNATVSQTLLSWTAGTRSPLGLNWVRGNYLVSKT